MLSLFVLSGPVQSPNLSQCFAEVSSLRIWPEHGRPLATRGSGGTSFHHPSGLDVELLSDTDC